MTPTAAEVGTAYGHVREALRNHYGIHVHVGKTKIWNGAGNRPAICDMLERIAQTVNPRAKVWRGSQVLTAEQGMKVLGTPLEHEDYVVRHEEAVVDEQRVLLKRIPRVQSAWLLRLHCASARASYQLNSVPPDAAADFAAVHDAGWWRCLCSILQMDPVQSDSIRETAKVQISMGVLGLRSASRTRMPAFWSSWADCLGMIRKHHLDDSFTT